MSDNLPTAEEAMKCPAAIRQDWPCLGCPECGPRGPMYAAVAEKCGVTPEAVIEVDRNRHTARPFMNGFIAGIAAQLDAYEKENRHV